LNSDACELDDDSMAQSSSGGNSAAILSSKLKGAPVENPMFLTVRQAAKDMVRVAAEFGMTPLARSRLNNPLGQPPSGGPGSKFNGLLAG
jgi:phage terminase small subunit